MPSAEKQFESYPRPSVAVDIGVLTVHEGRLRVLLVQRVDPPHQGSWALPGGFLRMEESLDEAAERVLAAKAGLEGVFLEQLYTFGAPGRDPRARVLSVAYYALVDHARLAATVPALPSSRDSYTVVTTRSVCGPVRLTKASTFSA